MKGFVKHLTLMLTLVALATLTAFARETPKQKKITVTFAAKVSVNGTQIKPGTYRLHFDEQSGELTIMKNGDVLAKTKARIEKREAKARRTTVTTQSSGEQNELLSVTVGGEDENIVLTRE